MQFTIIQINAEKNLLWFFKKYLDDIKISFDWSNLKHLIWFHLKKHCYIF